MVDVNLAASGGVSSHFSQRAATAKHSIEQAENFAAELAATVAKGGKPSESIVKSGRDILRNLDEQVELYAFNAAILAGQIATNDDEINRQVATLERGVEHAEQTSARLRSTLDSLR